MISNRRLDSRKVGAHAGALLWFPELSATQKLYINLYQGDLLALRDLISSGIDMSIDAMAPDGRCDVAASRLVTHHLIVQPVQNLP